MQNDQIIQTNFQLNPILPLTECSSIGYHFASACKVLSFICWNSQQYFLTIPKGKMIRRMHSSKEVFIEDVVETASASRFTVPSAVNGKDLIWTLLHYLKTLLNIINNTDILIVRIINIPLLSITDRLLSGSASLEMKNLVIGERNTVWEFIQNATGSRITARITGQIKRRCYRIYLV
jgi:hypothetical protein